MKGVGNGKIDEREFKKKYNNIVDDVEKILDKPMLTRSKKKKNGRNFITVKRNFKV